MNIEQPESQQVHFPGHEFAAAREQMHLSVEQVASELHLPIKVLKVMESASPQSFHNPVFLRGYIRTYAKYLGLDANHYANVYTNLPGVDLKQTSVRSTPNVQPLDPAKSPIMKVFTWLFLIAIIAVIVWWSREQYGLTPAVVPDEGSSVELSTASQPTGRTDSSISSADSDIYELEVLVAPKALVEDSFAPPGDLAESDMVEQTVSDADATQPIESEAVSVSSGLYIRFSDDCWVQVRDASDSLIYSGVARGGTELQLEGDEPLSLVIGRRDAVKELFFNGELISLSSFTSGNVARFSLPLNQ